MILVHYTLYAVRLTLNSEINSEQAFLTDFNKKPKKDYEWLLKSPDNR